MRAWQTKRQEERKPPDAAEEIASRPADGAPGEVASEEAVISVPEPVMSGEGEE